MSLSSYVTLLRGINVGGNNIIRMNDLRSLFEEMGFKDVRTYIQSGNVIFRSDIQNKNKLAEKIEKRLSERFSYNSKLVVVEQNELRNAVKEAPEGFGSEPDIYRYDVFFLKETLSPTELAGKILAKDGVDKIFAGKSVLYASRIIKKASGSYLPKVITMPEYKELTIRNWNTTTKLLELMDHES